MNYKTAVGSISSCQSCKISAPKNKALKFRRNDLFCSNEIRVILPILKKNSILFEGGSYSMSTLYKEQTKVSLNSLRITFIL